VTGSNGKTTVKEMLAAILSCRGRVLATPGNLNNDIGMPLTLLRLQNEDYAVIELGASGPGEIEYLSGIARPDVVVLNNAGKAHLEGFGSLEGIARAKAEIISGLSAEGVVVLNGDDRWSELWRELAGQHRVLSFGMDAAADVSADPQQLKTHWNRQGFRCRFDMCTPQGEVTVDLGLAGRHNLMNALAAAAAALALGAGLEDIRKGLAGIRPVRARLQTRTAGSGLRVIDDTYNANPDSVVAAIEVLVTAPGRRWLILGDLAELGPESERLLEELGTRARAAGLDRLCTVGTISAAATRAFGPGARHFETQQALIEGLRKDLGAEDYVLVKGSRSAAMELVVNALLENGGG
jgi:UDP-N-acetylmuramoyl-tripeptide--D-alanyl-D-alanine ligase